MEKHNYSDNSRLDSITLPQAVIDAVSLLPPFQLFKSGSLSNENATQIQSFDFFPFGQGASVCRWYLEAVDACRIVEIPYLKKDCISCVAFTYIETHNQYQIIQHPSSASIIDDNTRGSNHTLVISSAGATPSFLLQKGFTGEIVQYVVLNKFLIDSIPERYFQSPLVAWILDGKGNGCHTLNEPPAYIKNYFLALMVELKLPSIDVNPLKLMWETLKLMHSFFRTYIGELSNSVYNRIYMLDDHAFKIMVIQYFKAHLYSPFMGIKALARQFYVSSGTIKVHFSKCFGKGPLQVFKELQMEESKMLLKKYGSVNQVAYLLCFSSASNFITCFRRHYKQTPGQFLKIN